MLKGLDLWCLTARETTAYDYFKSSRICIRRNAVLIISSVENNSFNSFVACVDISNNSNSTHTKCVKKKHKTKNALSEQC